MLADAQTMNLGEITFSYTIDNEQGVYIIKDGDDSYHFKEWSWGEQNAATRASIVFDPDTRSFHIDTGRFNEAMLVGSLVEAVTDKKKLAINPLALRKLKASQGDKLLLLAQWVNNKEVIRSEPRLDPEFGYYHLSMDNEEYLFKEWLWGEKNIVADQSVIYDPVTDHFRVDVATFNELMLEATLVKAPFEVTLENLRSLPASIGDFLLETAQIFNGLTGTEKKKIIDALRRDQPHAATTMVLLCRIFGWTPQQVRQQSASDIERVILILNEWSDSRGQDNPPGEEGTTILITEDGDE